MPLYDENDEERDPQTEAEWVEVTVERARQHLKIMDEDTFQEWCRAEGPRVWRQVEALLDSTLVWHCWFTWQVARCLLGDGDKSPSLCLSELRRDSYLLWNAVLLAMPDDPRVVPT